MSSYTPTSHVVGLKPPIRDEDAEQKAAAKVESAKRSLPYLCRQLGRLEAKAKRTEKENVDCAVLVAQIMRLNRLVRGIPRTQGVSTKLSTQKSCTQVAVTKAWLSW
jgi:hypothetical protein